MAEALGYQEMLVLVAACVAALVVAGLWMLLPVELKADRTLHPDRVVVGADVQGRLIVVNQGRRRSAPVVATERLGRSSLELHLPSLAPGVPYTRVYRLDTSRRGLFTVGPLVVGHTDPLRLLRVDHLHGATATLRVLPLIHAVAPVPTGHARDDEGPTSAAAPQGGVAFHSLREYVPGDDPRSIHWHSSARTGRIMVRHNVVTNQPVVLVVLDTCRASYQGDSFEDAVRVVASLVNTSSVAHFPVQLHTTGGLVACADASGAGRLAMLDMLAEVQPAVDDLGLAVLKTGLPHRKGVTLAVVTGQPDPSQLRSLSAVRARFDMATLVQVGGGSARAAALPGVLTLSVATSADFEREWNKQVRPG